MKYYIALYEKLKSLYKNQSSSENDISLMCPSLRIYEREDLQLLKPQATINDTSKLVASQLKKQDASYQLNTVPVSSTFWDVNPNNSLFSIYREILDGININGLETSIEGVLNLDTSVLFDAKGKETIAYKAYQKYLSLLEKKLDEITEHLNLYNDLTTEEQKENWTNKLDLLNKEKEICKMELEVKGYKNKIESSLKTINKQSLKDQQLSLLQSAKMEFDASEHTDIISNNSIHNINFIPYDFMDNETGWTNLSLSKKELDSLYEGIDKSGGEFPTEILNIDYDEKIIIGIQFDYQFVTLKRNWFNKEIFYSGIAINTIEKPISDGVTISSEYKLPAFPKTMILIKNLKINLDPSVDVAQVTNPSQIINFGPLILKQQLFTDKKTNQNFLKVVTNKDTAVSEQLHYMVKKAEIVERTAIIGNKRTVSNKILRPGPFPKVEVSTPAPEKNIPSRPVASVLTNLLPITIFTPVEVPAISSARVSIKVTDSISKTAIYKCSLSIKGTDNNRFYEIETNENGEVIADIPPGNYSIEMRLDGYANLLKNFNISNTNNTSLNYTLEREQVKYASFFLIGMICERIPKTK